MLARSTNSQRRFVLPIVVLGEWVELLGFPAIGSKLMDEKITTADLNNVGHPRYWVGCNPRTMIGRLDLEGQVAEDELDRFFDFIEKYRNWTSVDGMCAELSTMQPAAATPTTTTRRTATSCIDFGHDVGCLPLRVRFDAACNEWLVRYGYHPEYHHLPLWGLWFGKYSNGEKNERLGKIWKRLQTFASFPCYAPMGMPTTTTTTRALTAQVWWYLHLVYVLVALAYCLRDRGMEHHAQSFARSGVLTLEEFVALDKKKIGNIIAHPMFRMLFGSIIEWMDEIRTTEFTVYDIREYAFDKVRAKQSTLMLSQQRC
jgi:hypothetical protein